MSQGDFIFDVKVAAGKSLARLNRAAEGEIDMDMEQILPASELVSLGLMLDRSESGGASSSPMSGVTLGDFTATSPLYDYITQRDAVARGYARSFYPPSSPPNVEVVSDGQLDYSVLVDNVTVGKIGRFQGDDEFRSLLEMIARRAIERDRRQNR